jgi:hypothetical protein
MSSFSTSNDRESKRKYETSTNTNTTSRKRQHTKSTSRKSRKSPTALVSMRELTASQAFDIAQHGSEFREYSKASTRSHCKMRRDFGMPPSCHMVKTYQLIFVALSNLGYAMNEKNYALSHDIKELLYTSLSYGLSRPVFTNQHGNLESTIRAHFGDNAETDAFIAKIKFLQEFNIIVCERPEGYLQHHLEHVTHSNFEHIWSKLHRGKEYFILFSGNDDRGMHAFHYFICGQSESEGAVKIYSAWGSDRVQNAFKSMTLNKEMFLRFVSSINAHQPGNPNPEFRDFLMATMLRPENERYQLGTISTAKLTERTPAYQTATRNIEQDIQSICAGKLGMYRVPALNDKRRSYLDTLTEVIRFGIDGGLFVNAPKRRAASSASMSVDDDDILDNSIDFANSDDSEDPYAVGGSRRIRTRRTRKSRKIRRTKTRKPNKTLRRHISYR